MHQAGKQSSHQLGATSTAGRTQCRLFYLTDCASGLKCLIDTGTEVSVVLCSHTRQKIQKGPSLQAINNTSITKYGTYSLTLNLGLYRTFFEASWSFSGCEIALPLTHIKVQGIAYSVTSSLVLSLLPKKPKSNYRKILMDFTTITNSYNRNIQIKHDVTHRF